VKEPYSARNEPYSTRNEFLSPFQGACEEAGKLAAQVAALRERADRYAGVTTSRSTTGR